VLPTQPRPAIPNVGVVVNELHVEDISMIKKKELGHFRNPIGCFADTRCPVQ
jgi:hypothetical protein